MKIFHLSDTHIGRGDNARRTQRLLEAIDAEGSAAQDLIIHTGDLIDQGSLPCMQQGRALLDAMAAKGWRVLLCPGNHDYGDA